MKERSFIILLLIFAMTFTGCWGRREPKHLAIVNSAIYDINNQGEYQVTVEIINPSAGGGAGDSGSGEKSPTITAVGKGSTIREAISNQSQSVERSNFGGDNKVRFFTDRFARKDMVPLLDYLLRDNLTDETPLMVMINEEEPEKIYTCMIGLSDMVGDYIESLNRFQPQSISKSVFVSTLDFVKDYYSDGKQPVMGLVEIVKCSTKPSENVPVEVLEAQDSTEIKHRIIYEGLAAFKDNVLVGYMDGVEARAYNFMINNMHSAYISVASGENHTVFEVSKSKTETNTSFEGDNVNIDVNVRINTKIIAEGGDINISKQEPLKAVEEKFNQHMEEELLTVIKRVQEEFESDIFGFGNTVHNQHPEKWNEIKDQWDDYFSKANISLSVKSSVNRSGEIKEPFRMEE